MVLSSLRVLLILGYQIKYGKRQIRMIVLRKAVETVCNINQAFGEGIINKRIAQHCFRRLRNGDECLEDEEGRRIPLVIDDSQLRIIVEEEPRKTTREVVEELHVN
uniref:HTH_48 domain-containing protein n=1 Tax=Heterorhabditis bacteriophora TaxID=37862 RepID=A0A1I7XU82_HETBA